jgi:hypothetical protein
MNSRGTRLSKSRRSGILLAPQSKRSLVADRVGNVHDAPLKRSKGSSAPPETSGQRYSDGSMRRTIQGRSHQKKCPQQHTTGQIAA